jgi:curved DNA-binding protein CbpA
MFFSGVVSKQSIKKRYKDLIKIYHPDNLDGDKDTIQEINSEYNKLCARYKI